MSTMEKENKRYDNMQGIGGVFQPRLDSDMRIPNSAGKTLPAGLSVPPVGEGGYYIRTMPKCSEEYPIFYKECHLSPSF